MQNSHRQLICILIAVFTLLQLVILLVFGYTPYPDSEGYLLIANDCITHHEPYPIISELYDYPFLWNIGAINIVVASLYLFHSFVPVLVVYSLAKGVTAFLFHAITKKICGAEVAIIALILYIVYPANYGEGTSLLSELPFLFFILLGMYSAIVRNWSFSGGMMLAVANWFRPMAIIFLLALLVYFLLKWRKSIKMVLGYIVMTVIIGTVTMNRTGLFLYQAKTGWMALMDYSSDHAPASMAVRDRTDWDVCQKDSAWQALFIEWLKDHPREYVAQMPQKLINTYVSDNVNMCTFIPDKTASEYMYEAVSLSTLIRDFPRFSAVQWLTLINLFFYYILIIASIASLYYFKLSTHLLPISIISLGTLLLLFVGHGEARFHIPFMPFIILLSSVFIHQRYVKKAMG